MHACRVLVLKKSQDIWLPFIGHEEWTVERLFLAIFEHSFPELFNFLLVEGIVNYLVTHNKCFSAVDSENDL